MATELPPAPDGHCFHCLQPLPDDGGYDVIVAGQSRAVCCYGCQAVAQTINDQNLLHFYQFRDTSNPLQIPLLPEELQQLEAYDQDELQDQFTQTSDSGLKSTTLSVEGMTCAACAWLIEQQLQRQPGVQKAQVNATTERVLISWLPEQIKLSSLLQHIAGLGYRALPFQAATQEQDFKRRRRYFIRRIGIAGLATMQVMMIAIALYFGMVDELDQSMRQFFWWISLLFATPVLLYSAQPFYMSALRSLQARQLNMDVPVSLALLSAYGASAYATFTNHGEVYFESVSMFTFLLLVGRYLELLARQRAVATAANLVKLLPATAQREGPNGELEAVAVHKLQPGDIVRVLPGQTLPADGELVSEQAEINESMLTGESVPVSRQQNETVYAGTLNQTQPIRIAVQATQQNTVMAKIAAMQDQALANKPKLAVQAERLASQFVKQLLFLAAATFLVWSFIDPEEAFWVTLAVLVATCPCALALAAPTAVTGVIHQLNKQGILLRNTDAIEALRDCRTLIVDKTGTLTSGKFSFASQTYLSEGYSKAGINALASALEKHSEHPLAEPFKSLSSANEKAPERVLLDNVQVKMGAGIEAIWTAGTSQQPVRIGHPRYIAEWHPEAVTLAPANVILATADEVLACFQVTDTLRDDVPATLATLRTWNYEIIMLTGDSQANAERVAQQLQISNFKAQCLPEDKLAFVKAQQQHGPVFMVGDGINDGPVLAQADVSMTFGQAADLARQAADSVAMRNDFAAITTFIASTRKSRRILKQNISWALLYNIGIIPIAVLGLVTPYIAAIGMSLSSLLVLANSLRLYRSDSSATDSR
ncbi:heavy metal translocating P-type ATPase [Pseudidiomarina terrestris]|uniref:Heavy metal translocating P-type ATPase n=1 Tax=Pseudidiomarina terrestris TaxID=2820060 RepID=A0AAW7QYP2_9GAMM|nr:MULTISPECIES: heavy metal translocating P-type ATPase [unclassified Pseudidiomarina]MDN7123676.1 heavy metal translocating P-type ATPase [Pseudidiomarina sp. 1APP75-32.1]MDN7128600.1 heavy metal translocating P-type ATPase [Pseudidiomarina sp. 1APR75-15]MDN7135141.1 heavy metal translocating P-type ATPase [Pseudidiomarina sp. 1ASP75-5]MEA3587080.1 heavy metal translocating P-type ATPase [Pseudidiomarina sp. 1APP75-27a]